MNILEHPIVFYLFGIIPVRDTVVTTWILDIFIIGFVLIIRKTFPSLLDMLIESLTGFADEILDVENLNPYLPVIGSLFIFLFTANIFSVIPVLRSPTADINTPLALALIIFFAVHLYGIWTKGFWKYITTIADPIFLLPLEIVSQISRTLSLTLRLFGNIMSSDLIVAIVFSIIPMIAPIPFIVLSLFSGALQAYIMTTLATLYIGFAVEISQDEHKRKPDEMARELLQKKEI